MQQTSADRRRARVHMEASIISTLPRLCISKKHRFRRQPVPCHPPPSWFLFRKKKIGSSRRMFILRRTRRCISKTDILLTRRVGVLSCVCFAGAHACMCGDGGHRDSEKERERGRYGRHGRHGLASRNDTQPFARRGLTIRSKR